MLHLLQRSYSFLIFIFIFFCKFLKDVGPFQIFLFAWKDKILELVDDRVRILNFWRTPSVIKPMLWEEVLTSQSELHTKLVVVPIYKAANNIALICKRFYILKLLTEVDIPGNTSSIYKLSEDDPNNITPNNTSVKNLVYLSMINLRHFPSCIGYLRCMTVLLELD